MVLIILIIMSLSAIYFTRLLYNRGFKVGAMSIAVLFASIIFWIYFLFIFDVADFGFAEVQSKGSLLFGSNIYGSFVELNAEMSLLPTSILHAIVAVSMLTLTAAIIVVLDGVFRVAGELYKIIKSSKASTQKFFRVKQHFPEIKMPSIRLNRLYCRANC